ncbi:MAG: xylobiose transport system substrate-binding protein [Actinomycetota bacterium]|nr:xylobiose transport system substrate-binding protein [Actinomycetota bacterium]
MEGHARPRRRGLLVTAATLALAVAPLTACGSDGSEASGKLNVWVYQDGSTRIQKEAVERFNKTSKVKVVLNEIPADGYQDKVRTGMGSSNAPDVFFNWGGGSIRDYVTSGKLLDLTPTFDSDSALKSAFLQSVLDAGKIDGKYYGVPMRGTQPVILFYNKDLFAQNNVEPPTSWEDMLKLVDLFKAKGVTPFSLAGANSWTELMWVEYLLDRFGGVEVFDKIASGDSAAWGDPAMLKTAQAIKQLVDRGAFGKKFGSVSYTAGGASTLFAKGKTAMHLMGSWEYATQLTDDPEFAKSKLGWATFPSVPGGKGDPTAIVGNPTNFWSINASTKNKDAAIEFVKTAMEDEYIQAMVDNGDVPTTANTADLLAKSPNPEFAKAEFDMVQKASSFTLSWDQNLSASVATPMLTEIQKLFNGQITPEKFVESLKALK